MYKVVNLLVREVNLRVVAEGKASCAIKNASCVNTQHLLDQGFDRRMCSGRRCNCPIHRNIFPMNLKDQRCRVEKSQGYRR